MGERLSTVGLGKNIVVMGTASRPGESRSRIGQQHWPRYKLGLKRGMSVPPARKDSGRPTVASNDCRVPKERSDTHWCAYADTRHRRLPLGQSRAFQCAGWITCTSKDGASPDAGAMDAGADGIPRNTWGVSRSSGRFRVWHNQSIDRSDFV